MSFSFDKSYWSAGSRDDPLYCSQQTLYDDLGKELLDHGFAGFNACILACQSVLHPLPSAHLPLSQMVKQVRTCAHIIHLTLIIPGSGKSYRCPFSSPSSTHAHLSLA